jgi:hypothetical protein
MQALSLVFDGHTCCKPPQFPDFFHMKPLSGISLIPSLGQRYGQTIGGKHTAIKAVNSLYAGSTDCSELAFVLAWSENFKKRHSYPCALTIRVVGSARDLRSWRWNLTSCCFSDCYTSSGN